MARSSPKHDYKILEITWLDATTDNDDYTMAEIRKKKPYYCERICLGYYVGTDDEYIILCNDILLQHGEDKPPDKRYTSLSAIPKAMIKKKRWIKV